MKKILVIGIIALESIGIVVFVYKAYLRTKTKNSYKLIISPLQKKYFRFPSDTILKYYYEPKPNTDVVVTREWLPYSVNIHYNSEGLNATTDYPVVKPSGTFRIVALGDSWTHGEYVNPSDNYPSQLERMLNQKLRCPSYSKYEVLNLGVPGYDIQYAEHRFKLHGIKYNPDLLIWLILDNDFTAPNELVRGKINQYEEELVSSGAADPEYVNGVFFPAWRKLNNELFTHNFQEKKDELATQGYRFLTDFTAISTGPLLIATPNQTQIQYKKLLKLYTVTRGNAFVLDTLPDLASRNEVLPDGHPTVAGYASLVRELFSYIMKNNIISCN